MKRPAGVHVSDMPEDANRCLPTVCTGGRPAHYVCKHCNVYAADVYARCLWFDVYDPETRQHLWYDRQWVNLCNACLGKVDSPMRVELKCMPTEATEAPTQTG